MKEKTILINMRIGETLLKSFDKAIAKDPQSPSRTTKIKEYMAAEVRKAERREKK